VVEDPHEDAAGDDHDCRRGDDDSGGCPHGRRFGSMIFWLWTPRFLLHREVSLRSLLPAALLATFVVGGTIATSPLWIGPTLDQNAKAFGAFGVVIGLLAYASTSDDPPPRAVTAGRPPGGGRPVSRMPGEADLVD